MISVNHFNFGFGSHECLGKYVGMVMIPEMVRQVLLRRNLRSKGTIDYKGVREIMKNCIDKVLTDVETLCKRKANWQN